MPLPVAERSISGLRRAADILAIWIAISFPGMAGALDVVKPDRVLFRAGDGAGRAELNHDDSDWLEIPEVALAEGWGGLDPGATRGAKIGWYRLHFSGISESQDIAWIISAGFIGTISEAYWDGRSLRRIGVDEAGMVIPPPQRTVHAWPLAAAMLGTGDGGRHVLAVRVRRVIGAGGLNGGPVGLFPASEFIRKKAGLELGREVVVCLVSSFAMTWGLIFILVRWIGDQSQPWVFGAGLFLSTGIVHLMSTQLSSSLASGEVRDSLVFASVMVYWAVPILSPWLIRGFCGGKGMRREVFATVSGGIFMLLAHLGSDDLSRVIACYGLLLVMVGVVAGSRVAGGWKHRTKEVFPVLVGLVCLALSAGAQISLFWIPWMRVAAAVWQPMDAGILATVGAVGGSFLYRYAVSRKRERLHAERVLESQRHERSRIGRHLHDGVAQDLQYLMFEAKQWAAGDPGSPHASVVVDGIGTAIREVRRSAEDLQPLALKSGTLRQALEALVRRLNERHDCEVTMEWGGLPELLDSDEETLFRAASEAALNACRHARAGSVHIQISSNRGVAGVRVIDDGRGFDPDGLASERLGLRFLRDQAELTGGVLEIHSHRGEGTTVEFRLSPRDFLP